MKRRSPMRRGEYPHASLADAARILAINTRQNRSKSDPAGRAQRPDFRRLRGDYRRGWAILVWPRAWWRISTRWKPTFDEMIARHRPGLTSLSWPREWHRRGPISLNSREI